MAGLRNKSLLPVLDGVLLVAMMLATLVALLSLLDAVTSEHVSELTIGLSAEDVRETLPEGVTLDKAEAVVDARTGLGWRLAWWAVGSGSAVLVVLGASVLRDIVATARAGDPFVAANVRRLRIVALLTLGHGVLALVRVGVALAIQNDIGVEDAVPGASGVQLVAAIVLFAVAEIWQRGVDLRDEQELTV